MCNCSAVTCSVHSNFNSVEFRYFIAQQRVERKKGKTLKLKEGSLKIKENQVNQNIDFSSNSKEFSNYDTKVSR